MALDVATAIRLEQVTKRYGDGAVAIPAVCDVTLSVATGEFVAVVGPSGSGKSTLLNLIAGLDVADEGRIEVAGLDLAALSDDERSDLRLRTIGFVFQAFHLFPALTAEENVAWPAGLVRRGWREARARAATMLERVGIDAMARRRRPGTLSGGEQQRVAIARALVTEPAILLADEPTGNLDSHTADSLLALLRELNDVRGVSIVLVTHNPRVARSAHRQVELLDGRLVCEAASA